MHDEHPKQEIDLKPALLALQAASANLEPSEEQRAAWQAALDCLINRFYAQLPLAAASYPVADVASAAASATLLSDFDTRMSQASSVEDILATLTDAITASSVATAGPGYLGFIPGGGLYVGALADHLAAALNVYSAAAFTAPIAVHIHEQVVRWLCDMVGYGPDAWGDITSGGSHATLTALYVARTSMGIRARDYERTCVYLSEHTHHCAKKALRVLFGDDLIIRTVPLRQQVMDSQALAELIAQDLAHGLQPFMLIATAGSTNLGRIDPLPELAALARQYGLWLHVDGAYGGFFRLCDEVAAQFAAMELADSIILDPHKGMFLPYGCGAVLFRDGKQLRAAMDQSAAYLQDVDEVLQKSPMDYSLELSRPFRSLRIWLALKVHGVTPIVQALREKLLLARYCQQALQNMPQLHLLGPVDLSILAFRFHDSGAGVAGVAGLADKAHCNARTRQLFQRINARQEVFLSSSMVEGFFVIRIAILSFRTHLLTIDQLIESIAIESAELNLS